MAIFLIISRLLYARDLHENKSLAKRRNEALDNRIGECFNNNSKGVEPIFQLSPPCGGDFFCQSFPGETISTLSPRAGCDVMTALLRRPVVILTLSPCAGRDVAISSAMQ